MGFQFRLEPGLLQIEEIDLERLQPITEDSRVYDRTFVMNCYPLFKIMELANVNSLRITLQSNEVLHTLIGVLSTFGSLRKLAIMNIGSRVLFDKIGEVITRHNGLEELKLGSIPESRNAEVDAVGMGYSTRGMILKNEHLNWFRSLSNLRVLDLRQIIVPSQLRTDLLAIQNHLPKLTEENILF